MAQKPDIGDLIMLLNPYTNDRFVGKGGPHTGEMDIYMLDGTPTQGGDPAGTIAQIQLEVDATYPGDWTFKGQPHKLGKSARIRYRYPVLNPGPGPGGSGGTV